MAFLEEMSAGFHVGYEVCTLANHCARNDTDALVRDLLEAIDRHRYVSQILKFIADICNNTFK